MDKSIISNHIYNDSTSQAIKYVNSITDEETLFIYAYNYNWDNGFDVPKAILNNSNCSLSIALMLFFSSDGFLYLTEKNTTNATSTWNEFISNLYNRIKNNEFKKGITSFDPQLTKVQAFKLNKLLDNDELLFVTSIDGIDCYQNL